MKWKRRISGMGIPVGQQTLISLLFTDDQVLIIGDKQDSNYMFRKFHEEYSKLLYYTIQRYYLYKKVSGCRFQYNTKLQHIQILITLTTNRKSTQDISNKMAQGKGHRI